MLSQLLSGHDFVLRFSKGPNSIKNVGRVTVLGLRKLPGSTLYSYQVS